MNYKKLSKVQDSAESFDSYSVKDTSVLLQVLSKRFPEISSKLHKDFASILKEVSELQENKKSNLHLQRRKVKKEYTTDLRDAIKRSGYEGDPYIAAYLAPEDFGACVQVNSITLYDKANRIVGELSIDEVKNLLSDYGWKFETVNYGYHLTTDPVPKVVVAYKD